MDYASQLQLGQSVTACEFSTHFRNCFAVGTLDRSQWQHGGRLIVGHVKYTAGAGDGQRLSHMEKLLDVDLGSGVRDLTWCPTNSGLIVCGLHNSNLSIWDARNGTCKHAVRAHSASVTGVSWNEHKTDLLLSSSVSSVAKLHQLSENSCVVVHEFREHKRAVSQVRWNPNSSDEFASACMDGVLRIWDIRDPRGSIASLLKLDQMAGLLACDWKKSSDRTVAVGTVNGTIYLWDVRNPVQPLAMRPSHQKPCTSLKFSTLHPDCLYSTSDDGSVRVWSTTSNDLTFCAQHALHTSRVGCVDVNPHGRPSEGRLDEYVLSADEGGNVLHVGSSGLSHATQDSTAQGADLKLQKPVPLQELDASTQHWLQGGTGTGSQLTFPSLLPAKL